MNTSDINVIFWAKGIFRVVYNWYTAWNVSDLHLFDLVHWQLFSNGWYGWCRTYFQCGCGASESPKKVVPFEFVFGIQEQPGDSLTKHHTARFVFPTRYDCQEFLGQGCCAFPILRVLGSMRVYCENWDCRVVAGETNYGFRSILWCCVELNTCRQD